MNRIEIKLIANRALDSACVGVVWHSPVKDFQLRQLTCHYVSAAYVAELRNYPIKRKQVERRFFSLPPLYNCNCNTCQQVLLYSPVPAPGQVGTLCVFWSSGLLFSFPQLAVSARFPLP